MQTSARKLVPRLAALASLGACLLASGPAGAKPAVVPTQRLDLRVSVVLVPGSGTTLRYRGTFTGTPFGRGTVDLRTTMGGAGDLRITFVMANRRGTVQGVSRVTMTFRGSTVVIRGTARITRGTGAYRRVRARGLRFSGTSVVGDIRSALRLTGPITS